MRGEPLLRDPFTNKGTAFTAAERADLALEGLVPPAVSTMDQQLARVYENYCVKQTPLERHIRLTSLQDRNETLFFRPSTFVPRLSSEPYFAGGAGLANLASSSGPTWTESIL
jgi:hypothetical protein